MALTKATYAMVSSAPFSVLDYGADPTGATDSTAAFNAALTAAVAAGGGSVYAPRGTYLINGRVDINGSNLRIYGDGEATVLRKTPAATHLSLLFLTDGVRENIEIDHLKFTSNIVYAPEYSWAFIDGALGGGDFDNIYIHDNYFTAPDENRAMIIFASGPTAWLDRLRIVNNVFDNTTGAAIAILNQNADKTIRNFDIKIIGNTFNTCKYFCITISGPTASVIISENSFSGTYGNNGYGIELVAGVRGCIISNNVFSGGFDNDLLSLSGSGPTYDAHSNVLVKDNVTTQTITAGWSLQSASNLYFDGNTFYTTSAIVFNGGTYLGVNGWFINNRTNLPFQGINGASIVAFNNYPGSTPPLETGFFKQSQLSGGGTTSTVVVTAAGGADWKPVAFRVSCAQVFGDGSGGGFAQSIIAFRAVNSGTATQISKTDTVTSAGVTLTVAYGTNTATVTATSGTANVLQRWNVEILSDGISTIV